MSYKLQSENLDSAEIISSKALKLSSDIEYIDGIGEAYSRLSSINLLKGQYAESVFYGRVSRRYFTQSNNKSKIALADIALARVFINLGSYDSAFFYCLNAEKNQQLIGDSVGLAVTFEQLGNYFDILGNYSKSKYYYSKCLGIRRIKGPKIDLISAFSNYAITFMRNNDVFSDSLALIYYDSAIDVALGNNLYSFLTDMYIGKAIIFKKWGLFEEALQLYQKSLSLDMQFNNFENIAVTYSNLGNLYKKKNQIDTAIIYYNLSQAIADSIHLLDLYSENLKRLGNSYYSIENYKEAADYYFDYSMFKDSLLDKKKITEISNMAEKYEIERQDSEIKLKSQQLQSELLRSRLLIFTTLSLSILVLITIFLFIQHRRLSKRKALLAQQKIESLLNDQELKSINAMLEGQDNERKRIAEDLHDRVGSILSTIKLYFGSLNLRIDTYQDENKLQYEKANLLLDEAAQEVRRISHNLISGILMKFGLVPALKDLCDTVEGTQQLKINLKVFNVDERMDGQTEISIYRIIQELLSNVLKHAKATEITISLTRDDGNLNIIVEDNGKGFDTNLNFEGIGLKNIRSRVEKLKGEYHIDSTFTQGTTININIPI